MRGSCKLNVGVVGQMGCLATATLTLTQGK